MIAAAFAILALFPPAHGRMMLVPVGGASQVVAGAVKHGARIVGSGRVPGTIVVDGDRARIGALLDQGILILAAPEWACGNAERRA